MRATSLSRRHNQGREGGSHKVRKEVDTHHLPSTAKGSAPLCVQSCKTRTTSNTAGQLDHVTIWRQRADGCELANGGGVRLVDGFVTK